MNRVAFFALHNLVHVAFYILPATIFNVFFRWPISALEWIIGEKEMTLAPRKERRIVIIKNCKIPAASDFFGLPSCLYYEEPMYMGWVQTILASPRPWLNVPYIRETLPAADGKCLLQMDCLSPTNGKDAIGKALVLILPGVNSSSQAVHVQRLAMQLSQSGHYVVVLNARDNKEDIPLYTQLLSDVQTEDLRYVLKTVLTPTQLQQRMKTTHVRPLIAVGFALGGVTLCKYIGEQGKRNEGTYLTAAIAMLVPFDSNAVHRYLHRIRKHQNSACGDEQTLTYKQKQVEIMPQDDNNNNNKRRRSHNNDDNDEHANARSAKLPEKFHRAADVYSALHAATIPVMCVATSNDPLCGGPLHTRRWEAVVDSNANVVYVEMPTGGHLAFMENPIEELQQKPNAGEQLIMRSLQAICLKNRP
ncbi:uncharacterized protein TM35_000161650 [Trypanosoma theileri]|uniref:AB hydrolase-1 domain-containing protein n=1 Tax=Trypanosoma theileri TaxID=67003 RepID=A0A1X0NUZ6_9TRYP|nr:uncharacterized protein TM35_000161650 [Trypanosoma theileri]ORC88527.1 hypothetical protein TM35_000161650 [Trypanosoma theileri]